MNAPADARPAAPRSALRDWKTWLGVAVTVALLYYAAPKDPQEWADMRAAFARADYGWLIVFWGLLAGFYLLKAWRWTLLLRPLGRYGVPFVSGSMMAGFAFNNVLPAHAGEGVRTLLFARQSGLPRTSVLATIALERLFDLVAICVFLTAGLLTVDGLPAEVRTASVWLTGVTAVGLVGAAAYVFLTETVIRAVAATLRVLPVPESIAEKIVELARLGASGLGSVRRPLLLAGTVASSLVQWAMNGLLAWIALRALGLEATLPVACVLLGVVAFSVTVPATPGFFGVIQGAFWLVLGSLPAYADQKGEVFAASLFYHLAQYVPVTLVGLGCYFAAGVPLAELLRTVPPDATARGQTSPAATTTDAVAAAVACDSDAGDGPRVAAAADPTAGPVA